MANITFLGLGNMGYPMAGHLTNAGHQVKVYNRSFEKAQRWAHEYPGTAYENASAAVIDADYILLCVGRDDDVRDLLTGEQNLITFLKKGALIIDHTTTSATLSEDMEKIALANDIRFADAPVSGGQTGAINGQLSIMVGCNEVDFNEIKNITTPYTKMIERMGMVGNGQKTKMVNQICVAGLLQALAEGLQFARNAGLDAKQVMNVISQGAASSWQLQNRHQSMIDGHFNHGFAIDWMHKDLQICLAEATNNGSELPVTQLVDHFFTELQQQGAGKLDTSALLLRLQRTDNR